MNRGMLIVTDSLPGDGSRDVSGDLNRLIEENPNRTLYFPDGVYLLSGPVLTPADPRKSVSLELANYAVLRAAEDWDSGGAMVRLGGRDPYNDIGTVGSNYALSGGVIDGAGRADGISIDSGRETAVRNVSVKHTRVGIHIQYGANSGSSDADITGVNIVGTGSEDSVGVLAEGFDNTFTDMRIANVHTGFELRSAGNSLRNIHPLYYMSESADYSTGCGFKDLCGNNWMNYCYSDQFATAFYLAGGARDVLTDCFAYWYSGEGGEETFLRCGGAFSSLVKNPKVGFHDRENRNIVLAGATGGTGCIEDLCLEKGDESWLSDGAWRDYFTGRLIG